MLVLVNLQHFEEVSQIFLDKMVINCESQVYLFMAVQKIQWSVTPFSKFHIHIYTDRILLTVVWDYKRALLEHYMQLRTTIASASDSWN